MTNVEQVRLSLSYHRGFLQPICSSCNMLQPLQRGQLRLLHAAREFCRKWLLKWKQKSRKPRPSKRQKNLRAVRAVNSHDVEFQGEMQNDSDGTRLYKTLQDLHCERDADSVRASYCSHCRHCNKSYKASSPSSRRRRCELVSCLS